MSSGHGLEYYLPMKWNGVLWHEEAWKATLSDSGQLQPTWTVTLGQANPQAKDTVEGLSRVHVEGNLDDEARHKFMRVLNEIEALLALHGTF